MRVSMFCDGGSRGNPGVAGSGSVVYGEGGETLAEIAYVVGAKASNNVAEYHGLLRGLEAARDLGATAVDVSMDSKLVVEQMTGRWKIKHPDMQALAREARTLAQGFDQVTYTWVPRAKNAKADELSNVAMDAAAKDGTPRVVETAEEALAATVADPAKAAAQAHETRTSEAKTHEVASPAHWSDAKAPRTRFVLLRHGQTEHSAQRRYSGTSDPELTEIGHTQAKRAADAVAHMGRIDAIISSPQRRAQQTAQYCAAALGLAESEIETAEKARAATAAGPAKAAAQAHEAQSHEAQSHEAKTHEVASPAHWSDAKAPRTRFVLLRHGQTEHSAQRRYSGTSDPELTEIGHAQAKRAAAAVARMGQIDAIISSPQRRALQTAQYCAAALGLAESEIETADGLKEMAFGDFEGLTRDEAIERFGDEVGAWEASPSKSPPKGESLTALHRRVTRERLKLQEAHEGQTVLVVTHMTPIKSVIRQALGTNAETFKHIFLDLASVSVVEFYGEFGVVRTVNDVAHHRGASL